jgi:hypothetical protein
MPRACDYMSALRGTNTTSTRTDLVQLERRNLGPRARGVIVGSMEDGRLDAELGEKVGVIVLVV